MVYCDLVFMDKDKEIETLTEQLGFNKVYYKEDMNKLGIVEENNYERKRKIIEERGLKILLNPHLLTIKDDLHYRSSGLDQVLCKLMNKNNISLGISLDAINNYVEIGRIMQNIVLCRKYKVKVLFFTFAKTKYELLSRKDVEGLLRVLGMSSQQVNIALNS